MMICPKCKKKIESLDCILVVDISLDCKFNKDGTIESDFVFNPNAYSADSFSCPLCGERIAVYEHEAKKLLNEKGDE